MKVSQNRILIGIVVLFSLTGCEDENHIPSYEYSPPLNVGDGWATASLQSVGMTRKSEYSSWLVSESGLFLGAVCPACGFLYHYVFRNTMVEKDQQLISSKS